MGIKHLTKIKTKFHIIKRGYFRIHNRVKLVALALITIISLLIPTPGAAVISQEHKNRPNPLSFEKVKRKPQVLRSEALKRKKNQKERLPEITRKKAKKTLHVTVTAYSSDVWQTDSSPLITASGSRVNDGTIAANFLPFGTQVRFPNLYGDKIFIVEDRMASRHTHRADIWFPNYRQAKNFGIKHSVKLEVLN